jgi:hypothetical protein
LKRQIFVDKARKRNSAKRGRGAIQVSLVEATRVAHEQAANVVALDYGLKVSPGTVMRDWTFARAWLRSEMSEK